MSEKDDGGSAFPALGNVGHNSNWLLENGMSLRDFFAAKAMQAMISTAAGPCLHGLDGFELNNAIAAYRVADAMLVVRKS